MSSGALPLSLVAEVGGFRTDISASLTGSMTGLFFFRKLKERYHDAACCLVFARLGNLTILGGNLLRAGRTFLGLRGCVGRRGGGWDPGYGAGGEPLISRCFAAVTHPSGGICLIISLGFSLVLYTLSNSSLASSSCGGISIG